MRTVQRVLGVAAGAILLIAPVATAQAGVFQPIAPAGFQMNRTGFDAATYDNIAKLEQRYAGAASIGSIVETGARTTLPLGSPPELTGMPNVVSGFRWDADDQKVDYWIPQGITGSADSTASGIVDGHRELVVSWYATNTLGSRVTFVNADHLEGAKYRHVLLVEPTAGGNFGLVDSHAGGIAWYGHYLYVAQTGVGLRVFDLRHIVRVPADRKNETLKYAYLLPQAGLYSSTNPGLIFSYVSVDRTGAPALVTGEFVKDSAGGRILRWPLNTSTGLLGAKVTAAAAFTSPVSKVQGALMLNGRIGTSSSNDRSSGTFTSGTPNQAASGNQWAVGAEDLTYAATSGRVYSLTEIAGLRSVFAVSAASVGL